MTTGLKTKKLNSLQKAILRKLKDTDEFWGARIDHLSQEIAKATERRRDENYIPKGRRRQLIYQKAMKGETDQDWAPHAMRSIKSGIETPKFRASFTRALKRLDERSFIYRIIQEKVEKNEDEERISHLYTGEGKTIRVVLKPEGRKWVRENL